MFFRAKLVELNLEALYQILFSLKLLAVYSYSLLFVYIKLLQIFTRLKPNFNM